MEEGYNPISGVYHEHDIEGSELRVAVAAMSN